MDESERTIDRIGGKTMIFVCGVSGSGKSHITSRLTGAYPEFVHVKGSAILVESGRPIRGLSPADAEKNQLVLHQELLDRNLISALHILDGHLTINTTLGMFTVPDWFFEQINVEAVICILDEPARIARRLNEKGFPCTIAAIDLHQKIERNEASTRASLLKCSYNEFAAVDLDGFARTLMRPGGTH
jgi:adenylate kinase